jgi:hypothetical protein
LTEEEEFIPRYHPNVRVWTIFGENFTRENERSENVEINLVWGTKDINREGENMWNPEFIGDVVFNEEFDFAKPENQEHLLAMCDVISKLDFVSFDEP